MATVTQWLMTGGDAVYPRPYPGPRGSIDNTTITAGATLTRTDRTSFNDKADGFCVMANAVGLRSVDRNGQPGTPIGALTPRLWRVDVDDTDLIPLVPSVRGARKAATITVVDEVQLWAPDTPVTP